MVLFLYMLVVGMGFVMEKLVVLAASRYNHDDALWSTFVGRVRSSIMLLSTSIVA